MHWYKDWISYYIKLHVCLIVSPSVPILRVCVTCNTHTETKTKSSQRVTDRIWTNFTMRVKWSKALSYAQRHFSWSKLTHNSSWIKKIYNRKVFYRPTEPNSRWTGPKSKIGILSPPANYSSFFSKWLLLIQD